MQHSPEPTKQDPAMPSEAVVILLDGVCNMCNASVNYVIDHDPLGRFRFASLQSEIGTALAAEHGIDANQLSSMVLIEDGRAYLRSTAALRVCRRLSGVVKLLWPLIIVPRPLRDLGYRLIAKNRYQLFGKREACRLPTQADRERFL